MLYDFRKVSRDHSSLKSIIRVLRTPKDFEINNKYLREKSSRARNVPSILGRTGVNKLSPVYFPDAAIRMPDTHVNVFDVAISAVALLLPVVWVLTVVNLDH